MKDAAKYAVSEQLETLADQSLNAAQAFVSGDTAKLRKALSIIERVARIVLAVIDAFDKPKATPKRKR